jgi:hypothetical protein
VVVVDQTTKTKLNLQREVQEAGVREETFTGLMELPTLAAAVVVVQTTPQTTTPRLVVRAALVS